MASPPPPPPVFAITPAAAAANFPDLFDESLNTFLFYFLIVMFVCCVKLRYCNSMNKQKPNPLKKEILKSLPKLTLSQECVMTVIRACRCVICLEDFVAGDVVRVLPLCRHEFHALCIDKWFQLGSTCPSCRSIPIAHQTSYLSPRLNVLIQD